MKKLIGTFLSIFVFLSACQSGSLPGGDTVVVGIDKKPEQFDPRRASSSINYKLRQLVFSSLLRLDESLNFETDLAESYQVTDSQVYDVVLKKGVKFHDGRELTSSDVKATYLSMQNKDVKSPYRWDLKKIVSIETPTPYRIIFKLKEPYVPFVTMMTLGVLPKNIAEKTELEKQDLIGSGPYVYVQNQKWNERTHLIRNQNYHGQKAKTKNLVFWTIQDDTLRSMELLKGRIDLIQNTIPYVLVPYFLKQDHLKFESLTGVNFRYLAFNFKNKYLKNLKVRKAIALAIDREKIIKYKFKKLATKATSVMNPKHWVFHPDLQPFSLDLEKAKKLLDEAGYPDPDGDGPQTRFSLEYKTSNNKQTLEIVQLIAENLRKIGVDAQVKSYEWGTFYRDIRQGSFDIFTLTWVGLFDPDIYYYVASSEQHPPNGVNRGFYKNPEIDPLLKESRVVSDSVERLKLFRKIQEIFYEDHVYVPLWYEDNYIVMNKNLKGYDLRADATYMNLVNIEKKVED